VLWLLFRLAMPPGGYSRRPFLQFGQEAIVIPTAETLKRLASPVAVVIGVFFGLSFSSDWNTYALFINSVPTPSTSDPIFGRPVRRREHRDSRVVVRHCGATARGRHRSGQFARRADSLFGCGHCGACTDVSCGRRPCAILCNDLRRASE